MIRIWLVSVLMGSSIAGAWLLTPTHLVADRHGPALADMVPTRLGTWRMDESVQPVLPRRPEDQQSLASRVYDQTVARAYRNPDGDMVMLVIAYGRDQSDILQLHLPEICYASQGFRVSSAGRRRISLKNGAGVAVNRLTTRRGRRFEPVTYWARVGDTVSLSNLSRQWAKLSYGLRGKVPDGVLIRVSTISNRSRRAFALQAQFVQEFLQAVDPGHRAFFLGEKNERHRVKHTKS